MRLSPVLVLAACAHPAPPPAPASRAAVQPCDEAAWRAMAESPLRARIDDDEVIVVEEQGGESRVIDRWADVLLGGRVPDRRLSRVVSHETPLYTAPGGAPLPGVLVEPGVRATGTGAWPAVARERPIAFTGVVPAEATGLVWEVTPRGAPGRTLDDRAELYAEPRTDAQRLAAIPSQEAVVDKVELGAAGWRHIEAHDPYVHVEGWAEPPYRSPLRGSYDFSDDVVEGELIKPDAPARDVATGCIRTEPDDSGDIVGLVTGTIVGRPAAPGWLRVVFSVPWGSVTGYARVRPPQPQAVWFTDDTWQEQE